MGRADALIAKGQASDAIAFAASCSGRPGYRAALLAHAFSAVRDDRDSMLKGAELWRKLDPDKSPETAFQVASALHGVIDLTRATAGLVGVLEHDRRLVREARVRYLAAAAHEDAGDRLRLVALVNCGNLYDSMGRSVDALRCYDRALAIDSTFGMGLGNKGMALRNFAPFMGGHMSHVLEEAAWHLDRAFEDEGRVREIGGDTALQTFASVRSSIVGDQPGPPHHGDGPRFADPHLSWAYRHRLLLHASPECLTDDDTSVDPLHLGSMVWSISDDEQARLKRLRDAYNTVKQEYLAARYCLWLADDPDSPIRAQTQVLSARGYFSDTLTYGRWGLQTGMGIQALTAATNTLDKIAGLVHLYFGTERRSKDVAFYGMWHKPRTKADKGKPYEVELAFADQLRAGNDGLAAILDLSCEIEGDEHRTPLKEQIARRHAATHRFLVAHDLPLFEADDAKWLERVEWADIVAGTIEQLQTTRSALIYFARAVKACEDARDHAGELIPPLGSWAVEDFDTRPDAPPSA
jgi:tetratricopeptide (TPR) repeat protein